MQQAERIEAWRRRDKKVFCFNHPNIDPIHEKTIKWQQGETTEKDGGITKFIFCPRCHICVFEHSDERVLQLIK